MKKILCTYLFACLITACSGNNNVASATEVKEQKELNDSIKEKTNITPYSTEYLLGKFNPKTDTSFLAIPLTYCSHEAMYLRKEALHAFIEMADAAKKDGISIKIISATRTFNDQKMVWEAKWNGSRLVNGLNLAQTIHDPTERAKKILHYSSMPGTSRHHWGTDIDINNLEPAYYNTPYGKKVYAWMKTNAAHFGFCNPYSIKNEYRPNGYEEEKWHWSYMPLSSELLIDYLHEIKPELILGFAGAETALKVNIIAFYVQGINPDCN